jgi:hypothetical protein
MPIIIFSRIPLPPIAKAKKPKRKSQIIKQSNKIATDIIAN